MGNIVFLVGAGPGDPGLLTVKGSKCLQDANVVVYDRLMDNSLLDLVPSECERIFVGKSRGRQAFTQDEIKPSVISWAARSICERISPNGKTQLEQL